MYRHYPQNPLRTYSKTHHKQACHLHKTEIANQIFNVNKQPQAANKPRFRPFRSYQHTQTTFENVETLDKNTRMPNRKAEIFHSAFKNIELL